MTETERTILDFEAEHPFDGPRKRGIILTQLRMKPVRYYAILNRVVGTREALEAQPMAVRRHERIADARQAKRLDRRFG